MMTSSKAAKLADKSLNEAKVRAYLKFMEKIRGKRR
jgi:hypothetical protein